MNEEEGAAAVQTTDVIESATCEIELPNIFDDLPGGFNPTFSPVSRGTSYYYNIDYNFISPPDEDPFDGDAKEEKK